MNFNSWLARSREEHLRKYVYIHVYKLKKVSYKTSIYTLYVQYEFQMVCS